MIIWHDTGGQGTPKWFKLRENLWTGSTAIRLLQGKMFRPNKNSDFTHRRGHALEFIAIREYEREYRTKVQRPDFVTNTVYPNAGYSPDGIDRSWLLECKALEGVRHDDLIKDRKPIKNIEEIIASRIPLKYRVQIFFGMIITGLRKARLLAINPELEEQLVVIEIGYDKLIGNRIRKLLRLDKKNRGFA